MLISVNYTATSETHNYRQFVHGPDITHLITLYNYQEVLCV